MDGVLFPEKTYFCNQIVTGMKFIGTILSIFSRYRYIIVIVSGVILLGFVGENSYMAHIRHQNTMNQLRDEIKEYEDQYKENTEKLELLETDIEAIKAVGRERYFMKAANEDVFIIQE